MTSKPHKPGSSQFTVRWPYRYGILEEPTYIGPIDQAQFRGAMETLFDRFDIPRGDWRTLATRLALEGRFITAARDTGPVVRWNEGLLCALWFMVGRWMHDNGRGVRPCTEDLGFLQEWADRSGEAEKPRTLETKYGLAKKSEMVKFFDALRTRHEVPEAVFWGEMVTDQIISAMFEAGRDHRRREEIVREMSAKF